MSDVVSSPEKRAGPPGVRLWRRIAWGDACLAAALSGVVYLQARSGMYGQNAPDWLDLVLAGFGALAVLSMLIKVVYRFRFAPPEELRSPPTEHAARMERTRDVLPEDPPPGWSTPLLTRASVTWDVQTGKEKVTVTLVTRGGVLLARVLIAPLAGDAPVGDARCAEVLRHMRGVVEFAESDRYPHQPEARAWLGVLRESKLPVPVPAAPPAPSEPDLSPHLVAARKHLPDKLPMGWSVPMAVTADHGTEWRDGAWAIGVDDQLVLACLCTSKGRVKLMVAIIRGDGSRASEGAALGVLKHFRGVLEFVETEGAEDIPGGTLYLGELPLAGAERAVLN